MPKRLTLFAPVLLAVVLSIGIMAWFGYHNAKDILEQELVAHQKMIAQSAVDAIHTYFTGITENVETLAASGPIRRLPIRRKRWIRRGGLRACSSGTSRICPTSTFSTRTAR